MRKPFFGTASATARPTVINFARQKPIGNYICDFVCRERLIVIEVDGGQHNESIQDSIRDRFLVAEGYRVLRFWNNDVLGNIEGVLTVIQTELSTQQPLTPTLSPQERGEGEESDIHS